MQTQPSPSSQAPRERVAARALVDEWLLQAHERSARLFSHDRQDEFAATLMQIAMSIPRDTNALNNGQECCIWSGNRDPQRNLPLVTWFDQNTQSQRSTWTSRFLVYCFALNNAYERLRQLPMTEPLTMVCDRPDCVQLSHVRLPAQH